MKIEINLDNSPVSKKFDSSLLDVYCLDFGDNYHRLSGEPTSEFEMEVRRLKGRYRDLSKFNQALSIYYGWMSYLENKYGGRDIFKAKLKAGFITDYVPKKPRLKNIKSLKFFYKNGIIISGNGTDINIYDDKLNQMTDLYTDQLSTDSSIKVEISDDKIADKISDSMYGRVKEYSSSFTSDIDYLQSYFMNKNKGKKTKKKGKKSKKENTKLMITDIMNGYYDDVADESEKAPLTTYNGLLLSTGTTKELDTYHKLSECGWDSYKIMKKAKYSKRVTSMFKVQKKKKKKNKSSNYDDLLIDIMTDNNYSDYEEFQKEMLNMTSDKVFIKNF